MIQQPMKEKKKTKSQQYLDCMFHLILERIKGRRDDIPLRELYAYFEAQKLPLPVTYRNGMRELHKHILKPTEAILTKKLPSFSFFNDGVGNKAATTIYFRFRYKSGERFLLDGETETDGCRRLFSLKKAHLCALLNRTELRETHHKQYFQFAMKRKGINVWELLALGCFHHEEENVDRQEHASAWMELDAGTTFDPIKVSRNQLKKMIRGWKKNSYVIVYQNRKKLLIENSSQPNLCGDRSGNAKLSILKTCDFKQPKSTSPICSIQLTDAVMADFRFAEAITNGRPPFKEDGGADLLFCVRKGRFELYVHSDGAYARLQRKVRAKDFPIVFADTRLFFYLESGGILTLVPMEEKNIESHIYTINREKTMRFDLQAATSQNFLLYPDFPYMYYQAESLGEKLNRSRRGVHFVKRKIKKHLKWKRDTEFSVHRDILVDALHAMTIDISKEEQNRDLIRLKRVRWETLALTIEMPDGTEVAYREIPLRLRQLELFGWTAYHALVRLPHLLAIKELDAEILWIGLRQGKNGKRRLLFARWYHRWSYTIPIVLDEKENEPMKLFPNPFDASRF